MPCPYFIPTERFDAVFVHPQRLPLGAGYRGRCGAPAYDGAVPSDEELHQCNMGYARNCLRLPEEREADAVRFSILRDRDGQIALCYVSELNYLPKESGQLRYELLTQRWAQMHSNERVQALADCYLQTYLAKR